MCMAIRTVASNPADGGDLCAAAPISSFARVLVAGAAAPKLISAEGDEAQRGHVDVSIDQGGTSETSRPTTHSTQPMSSMMWCIIASPTCLGRSRVAYGEITHKAVVEALACLTCRRARR